MPLEDYLLPGEEIRFRTSRAKVRYGGELWEVIVTNKRLLLYAQRGLVFKKDNIISAKLDEIRDIKYRERGLIKKTGVLEIHGKTLMQLEGDSSEVKPIYQQILQFI